MRDWIVCPTHADGWKDVADGFRKKWNFHHTLGAIDGKHIRIFKPPKAGSLYYNYKSYFSIIIMAIVDADGRFIYVDVGAPGSCSDGGVFRQTPLRGYLEEGTAGLPADQPLPGDRRPCPYFFVADAAFPMKTWLQKPHPQRGLTEEEQVYNQRISRARMIVENVFGMVVNKFRVFHTPINARPKQVEKMVLATCILHNMLLKTNPQNYRIPEQPNHNLDRVEVLSHRATNAAGDLRNYLTEYYNRPQNQRRRRQ